MVTVTTRYYFLNGWYPDSEFGPRKIIVDGAEVNNPDCRVPADAVEVTQDQYRSLLEANSQQGKTIVVQDGAVVAIDPPPPTPAQVIASNSSTRDLLLAAASVALSPLQMAVSLGEATEEETNQAKAWLAYSRAVKAIDLTQPSPTWPSVPNA